MKDDEKYVAIIRDVPSDQRSMWLDYYYGETFLVRESGTYYILVDCQENYNKLQSGLDPKFDHRAHLSKGLFLRHGDYIDVIPEDDEDTKLVIIKNAKSTHWYAPYIGEAFRVRKDKWAAVEAHLLVDCYHNYKIIGRKIFGPARLCISCENCEDYDVGAIDESTLLQRCKHDLYKITCPRCNPKEKSCQQKQTDPSHPISLEKGSDTISKIIPKKSPSRRDIAAQLLDT